MFNRKDLHKMYDKVYSNESFAEFSMCEIIAFSLITTIVSAGLVLGIGALIDHFSTEFAKWWVINF